MPTKRWRLVIATPDGPVYESCTSEAATRVAVEAAIATTPGHTIVVQKLNADDRWEEWLRWVRHDGTWKPE